MLCDSGNSTISSIIYLFDVQSFTVISKESLYFGEINSKVPWCISDCTYLDLLLDSACDCKISWTCHCKIKRKIKMVQRGRMGIKERLGCTISFYNYILNTWTIFPLYKEKNLKITHLLKNYILALLALLVAFIAFYFHSAFVIFFHLLSLGLLVLMF